MLNKLKARAKRHDLMSRKERDGSYWLVDIYTNCLAAPGPMTLEDVALWLDDLDRPQARQ